MATPVEVPRLGESVTTAILVQWLKKDGEAVKKDEAIALLETDKANVDLPAPVAGVLRQTKKAGDTVAVGDAIAQIEAGTAATAVMAAPPPSKGAPPPSPVPSTVAPAKGAGASEHLAPDLSAPPKDFDVHGERRVKMSRIRQAIAKRLVQAQQTAAILTTFNEVDLTEVMALRTKYKERFQEIHGVGLGFMSFFARAVVMAVKEFPRVNASLDGDDIVYHQHVNLGIAVSTDRGLA